MNQLALKLFLTKYYDLVFVFILLLIFSIFLFLNKSSLTNRINLILSKIPIKFLLFTFLVIGFIVRLYGITNPLADWHSFRQSDTASVTRVYLEDGLNLLYPRYHDYSTTQSGMFNLQGFRFVEFPIYNAAHFFLIRLFPTYSLEVWGRLLSIFSALVSAYIIFLIGRRFISKWGGLFSAFFYLFIPFNIYFTRVILPEPMMVTLALLALWSFIQFIDSDKTLYLLGAVIFMALALLIKPYAIFYTPPLFYLVSQKIGIKKILGQKRLLAAGLLTIVPFVLWRIWMQNFPEGIPFWQWTLNGDNIRFKPAFWYWLFGERITKLILGYWGLIPFAFGIMVYKKTRVFFYFLLLGMLLYMGVIATANVRHDYYQTIVIPSISLVLGAGVIEMWNLKVFNKLAVRGILIFSLLMLFLVGFFQVKEFYKINHPEIIAAGDAVDRLTPKDAVIIAAYNGDTAFLYQTRRKGWPVVDRPINELIERGVQYYVSVNLDHPQTREFMNEFIVIEKTEKYVVIKLSNDR
ncbi:hypothetical protein A3A52_02935 [Candidatus Woesebacteria bacterium RIFCSPLOWO2_01_FULL_39_14]|uniref:Glycosyltransferase RgtA/B/C/D-like domain-containing protein n=1 Tax=Candidatus Woesebacteria bacterium RIFCSPLOWO2_01_FULL_39_14 TaxID=1802518 RepID=A0A1F8BKA2_9BACT|nr:MAG: hypothetical protein A3A52_02935 [Candidatus Woesebacteria bacterium RIFCSPLOWO2_01_FULL_39_14]